MKYRRNILIVLLLATTSVSLAQTAPTPSFLSGPRTTTQSTNQPTRLPPRISDSKTQTGGYFGVMGAVHKPGVYYQASGRVSLAQLVITAGGISEQATGLVRIVLRGKPGLQTQLAADSAYELLSGDIVILDQRPVGTAQNLYRRSQSGHASTPGQNEHQVIALVNVLPRPVILELTRPGVTVGQIYEWLHQDLKSPPGMRLIHPSLTPGTRMPADFLSISLVTGSVLVFDAATFNREALPALPAVFGEPQEVSTAGWNTRLEVPPGQALLNHQVDASLVPRTRTSPHAGPRISGTIREASAAVEVNPITNPGRSPNSNVPRADGSASWLSKEVAEPRSLAAANTPSISSQPQREEPRQPANTPAQLPEFPRTVDTGTLPPASPSSEASETTSGGVLVPPPPPELSVATNPSARELATNPNPKAPGKLPAFPANPLEGTVGDLDQMSPEESPSEETSTPAGQWSLSASPALWLSIAGVTIFFCGLWGFSYWTASRKLATAPPAETSVASLEDLIQNRLPVVDLPVQFSTQAFSGPSAAVASRPRDIKPGSQIKTNIAGQPGIKPVPDAALKAAGTAIATAITKLVEGTKITPGEGRPLSASASSATSRSPKSALSEEQSSTPDALDRALQARTQQTRPTSRKGML